MNFNTNHKVQTSKFKVQTSKFNVQTSKFKPQSSKFKVQSIFILLSQHYTMQYLLVRRF